MWIISYYEVNKKIYDILCLVFSFSFDGNRKRKQKRKGLSQEESRLSHKVKKEMKSAVREILKDNAFLAKQQLKEQASKYVFYHDIMVISFLVTQSAFTIAS